MADAHAEKDRMLMVGKEHAADRLMQSQKLRLGNPYLMGDEPPSPAQVAAVLHALADHALIESMLQRAPALGEDRAHLGDSWALSTGLGRYLQRMGDWCEGHAIRPGSEVTTCDFCGHQGPPVGKNSECGSCGAISFHQAPDERPSRPGQL